MDNTCSPAVVTRTVHYQQDAGRLLEHLTDQGLLPTVPRADHAGTQRAVDTVLLETVDASTKISRTTIAVLDASARLTCQGDKVTAQALDNPDGPVALQRLAEALPAYLEDRTADSLSLVLPMLPDDGTVEERARLTALSTVEPLRVLAGAQVDHPHLPLEAGVFAFDYLATFETLPEVEVGENTCPDYLFYDARIILVVDHPTSCATLVGASIDEPSLRARIDELANAIDAVQLPQEQEKDSQLEHPELHAVPTQSDVDYEQVVKQMQTHISAGDIYQVVPSRGFTMPCPDALAVYHQLRAANPSPYMFYIATPDFELLGASPESALLYSAGTNQVAIRPIAGTQPRGLHPDGSVDHERDIRLELQLRTDDKEVAEHVMLVDLARNDVARVSVPGTRKVDDLLRVDRYSRVMHLVSEVSGQLAPDLDALDAFRASMTMGTLTGAPKLRAAELIRECEGVRRGSYGGSIGYLRGDGEFDTCIAIRSAFVRSGQALVQAGAGVVADSVPAAEAAETVHKASAVLAAVAAAQGARVIIDTTTGQEA